MTNTKQIVALILYAFLIGFVPPARGDVPLPYEVDDKELYNGWKSIEKPEYSIHFSPAIEQEAKEFDRYLQHAVAALSKVFADYDPDAIIKRAETHLYIYEKPNSLASESTTTTVSGTFNGEYKAYIHFLAPSSHSPGARTSAGEKKDGNYFFKTCVHEYSTVFLEIISFTKKKGWRLSRSPRWFRQGYEEYLGLTNAAAHSREITLKKYIDMVKEKPQRIDMAFGIHVTNVYVDGTALLSFMHDVYGQSAVQKVLASEALTFGEAMKAELGTDLAAFEREWRKWLKK